MLEIISKQHRGSHSTILAIVTTRRARALFAEGGSQSSISSQLGSVPIKGPDAYSNFDTSHLEMLAIIHSRDSTPTPLSINQPMFRYSGPLFLCRVPQGVKTIV
jgi:hypothetical protein